eukprot:TRINITY_DN24545_c0_g1_i1.p1 TRINITY_DN24545_c0_g1~~TRINITY_DN24545_c0_g1_i1.p1  ORF type:complete len:173 (+),score=18.98 TRINITY_DN24545_c0_g1_i1:97-615(+)
MDDATIIRIATARENRRPFLRHVPSEPTFSFREPGSRCSRIHDHGLPGVSKGWYRDWRHVAPERDGDPHGAQLPPRELDGNASSSSPPFQLPQLETFTEELPAAGMRKNPGQRPSFMSSKVTTRRADQCVVRGGAASCFGGLGKSHSQTMVLGLKSGRAGWRQIPGTGAFGK